MRVFLAPLLLCPISAFGLLLFPGPQMGILLVLAVGWMVLVNLRIIGLSVAYHPEIRQDETTSEPLRGAGLK